MIHPLKNLKVVDASSVLAGPSVGTYFAELGANVIKIEHPTRGDVTRGWKLPSEDSDSSISAYYSSVNYLKRVIRLDLSKDRNELVKEIEDADILLTNFKKGDDRKFGMTDSLLKRVNPRLIHGKITGYGSDSDRVAYDLILQAESGFMSMNGTPESGPVKMPVAMIDVLASHHLKEAILLALYERERSNKGCTVEVSLYDAALSSLVNQASNYLMADHIPQRIGSKHPNIAPYGELFKTKDGAIITFAIGSDTHFKRLCNTLHVEQLSEDDRFSTNQNRVVNRGELFEILQAKVADREADDILSSLSFAHVPAGKVKNLQEVFDDPKAKSLIREEEIEGKSTKRITSVVYKWT